MKIKIYMVIGVLDENTTTLLCLNMILWGLVIGFTILGVS
ncbi:hypothetical protein PEC302107_24530 [Pectobacterium araliae]|nr:hypothetical protein PEC302107_24530 [Pectobacterium carotovorum subsp. carotovorum]